VPGPKMEGTARKDAKKSDAPVISEKAVSCAEKRCVADSGMMKRGFSYVPQTPGTAECADASGVRVGSGQLQRGAWPPIDVL